MVLGGSTEDRGFTYELPNLANVLRDPSHQTSSQLYQFIAL
jgi:hypothetical protein